MWERLSHEPPPPSLGTKSGTAKLVGPVPSHHYNYDGEVIAVKGGIFLCEPDVWVSKHTEYFEKSDKDCLRITGDTWTVPGVEQWRLSAVHFSGVFGLLVAKLLGYERILIFGMPADYRTKGLSNGGIDQNVFQRKGWEKFREYFDGVTVYGGNLPKWFPELNR